MAQMKYKDGAEWKPIAPTYKQHTDATARVTALENITSDAKASAAKNKSFASLDARLEESETDHSTLNNKVSDLQSYVGYTDSDIFGVEVDFKNNIFTRIAGSVGKTAGANFDAIKAFGGRRRCNLADNGTINAYYGDAAYKEDGTNGQVMVEQPKFYYKVVPLVLDKNEFKEVNTIAITAVPTADGDLTITLNGVAFTVAVLTTDNTTTLVANKIRATSFIGWTVSGTGANVIFTANDVGVKSTAVFSGGTTGVTATVTKTQPGYVGKGFHNRKARYYVSDVKKAGFKVHPAFIQNGVEKNKVYLSAFEGSIYDTSALAYLLADEQVADFTPTNGDKLSSISGAKPASGVTQDLTRTKTRILAQNRGTGWQQEYAAIAAASQLLMIIEYAAFNLQTALAQGVVNKASGTGNESEITGGTSSLGNASGMATGTNGLVSISYRGEENFWGNIWKWVDGLNIYAYREHSLYVADNAFADNISTAPYKDAGITLAMRDGYISAFGYSEEYDWLFFPSETIGASTLPVGDYMYQNSQASSWLAPQLGGYWYHGGVAGAFFWSVSNAASYRIRVIGGRLVYVPIV